LHRASTADELAQREFAVERVNWTLDAPPDETLRSAGGLAVKIRYKAAAVPCTLDLLGGDRVLVHLAEPLRGVTPGQGAVFYAGDHCLGGGIIAQVPPLSMASLPTFMPYSDDEESTRNA